MYITILDFIVKIVSRLILCSPPPPKVNFLSPPFVLPIFYGFKELENSIFVDSIQVSTLEITPLRFECNTRCCFIYLFEC